MPFGIVTRLPSGPQTLHGGKPGLGGRGCDTASGDAVGLSVFVVGDMVI